MKIIELNSSRIAENFMQLKEGIRGSLTTLPREYRLEADSEVAKGTITGIEVNENVIFVEYDLSFGQPTVVINRAPLTNPVYFMYCARGRMGHSFGIHGAQRSLNQFQTGIFWSAPDKPGSFFFGKDQPVRMFSIAVNTHALDPARNAITLLQKQLIRTFIPVGNGGVFAYTGSYNLKIAEQIQRLDAIQQEGIIRFLLIKSIVHTLLAFEIQQHREDRSDAENNFGSLTRKEMQHIGELSAFIKNYPEVAYSLEYLSAKSGLSPAKLQEGFKRMHNRTVADHIRNVRLERAEHLIRTTDLNISEVVYTVGLTSRSYFSKIFKKKYGCSPKYYKDHQGIEAGLAG